MLPVLLNRILPSRDGGAAALAPCPAPVLPAGPAEAAGPARAGRKATPVSLLFVDDEPALREIGKMFLERMDGIAVTTAESGPAALALLDAGSFDAVVADYQMPGMDGIELLGEIRARTRTLPFVLFTGKGREEVAIRALNTGADHYIQKGGEPKVLYAELAHKVRRAVEHRRADTALRQKHAVLKAILAASPYGVAYVRDRTFRWTNASLASQLGYSRAELKGKKLRELYASDAVYEQAGVLIREDLKRDGRSRIRTRLLHREGHPVDAEIHIAPLDAGKLHLGHMLLLSAASRAPGGDAVADARPVCAPHLELTPVIEVDRAGRILYYNEAAITALARCGSRGSLEEFFPEDLPAILAGMDAEQTLAASREVLVGTAVFRVQVTTSPRFRIARLSAVRVAGT